MLKQIHFRPSLMFPVVKTSGDIKKLIAIIFARECPKYKRRTLKSFMAKIALS
jgi:hypothetical protein